MQFVGQTHQLRVPLPDGRPARETMQAAFERAYRARFHVDLPEIRANLEEDVNDLSRRSEENDWFIQIPPWDELGESFSGEGETTFQERLDQIREFGLRVFHVLLIFVLAPIIAFYLLVDLPHLRRVAESLVPEQSRTEVLVVPAELCATPHRMQSYIDSVEARASDLSLHWLPGLGYHMVQALAPKE